MARRFLAAEVAGTVLALACAALAYRGTRSAYAAGWAGSIGEAVGYYGAILAVDLRRSRTAGDGGAGRLRRAIAGALIEFGPAELLDTLLLRPVLMAAGPVVTGALLSGTLLGKVAADVAFYAIVLPSGRLRRRLLRGGRRTTPPPDGEPAPDQATRNQPARVLGAQAQPAAAQGAPPPAATPYLEMDLGQVERAYRGLRSALPEASVHYAMKCNPEARVLRTLHGLGASFEIASLAELTDLVAIGVPPREVLFSNPVKVPGHVRSAWQAGVYRFAIDSDAELDKIAEHAPGGSVYVRLSTRAAGSTVPSEGKFGVDPQAAARLLRRAVARGLQPYGITFHVGSQMLDPTAWADAVERVGTVLTDLLADGIRITMVDLGGGFPARYDHDTPSLTTYGKHIRAAVDQHLPYPVELVVEPGRALVAEAGVMVATVIGVAERGGQRWAHLDVGAFNGMMEALETANRLRYPVVDSRGSADRTLCHLTGPTCDSQDTVLYGVLLSADLAVGDLVRIGVAGAYTTGYASHFNGFDVPSVQYLPSDLRPGG